MLRPFLLLPTTLALPLLLFATPAAAARTQGEPVPVALPASDDAPSPPTAPVTPPSATPTPAAAEPRDAALAEQDDEVETPILFGTRGQLVLSSNLDFYASTTAYAVTDASAFSYGISPSFDWFAAEGFSIGGYLSGARSGGKGYRNGGDLETTSTTTWGAGARIGFNLRLSRAVSIWAKLSFSYSASKTRTETLGTYDATLRELTDEGGNVGAYVPLIVNVAPHAFVGFGPSFTRTLAHSQTGYLRPTGDGTYVGASFTVGGYL